MKRLNFLRWLLFTVGLGVAVGSCLAWLLILHQITCNGPQMLQENNLTLAVLEMGFLAFAACTCMVASETYWRYLKQDEMTYKEVI